MLYEFSKHCLTFDENHRIDPRRDLRHITLARIKVDLCRERIGLFLRTLVEVMSMYNRLFLMVCQWYTCLKK